MDNKGDSTGGGLLRASINYVTRESSRSRGGIGSDKFGKHVCEIGQLILHVLTLSLHVPHHSIISLYVGLEIFLRNHLEIEELELDRRELDKQEVEQPEVDRFDLAEPGVGDLGTKYVDHPFGAKDEVIFKWNFFKIKRSTTEVGPGDV
ncbi:hypothetical protein Tco_0766474 [Tanacetum coccineum]